MTSAVVRARLALEGLSVGDAFGECFFGRPEFVVPHIAGRVLPAPPWTWTDDTAMGLSVVDVLERFGHIDRDALAAAFAARYAADPRRGYGGTTHEILQALGHGAGQAGAIAVAVAAAVAAHVSRDELLAIVVARTPPGLTRDGIEKARALGLDADVATAAAALGTGSLVISSDTVPFALWCAARHLGDYEATLWTTVSGLGDRDTTCAIAGGVAAMAVGLDGIPSAWRQAREPLKSA